MSGGCPLCARPLPAPFVALAGLPVLCNALHDDPVRAARAPRADIELALCPGCGLISNRAFDPERAAYSPDYENSLHASPAFRARAEELAARLVDRYARRGTVLEIGPGSGDFLALLCAAGAAAGIGYDPSHDPARVPDLDPRCEIVAAPYPVDREVAADLVVCMHVLEHLADPVGLLSGVRRSIPPGAATACYVEVPDARYMLEADAVGDVIYEHPLYFSSAPLRWLLERCGFAVDELGRAFGDQYLWAEARPAAPTEAPGGIPEADLAELTRLAEGFGTRLRGKVAIWNGILASTRGPVVLWGAGSKGVSFLNLVEHPDRVARVVDLNPRKHGRYLPGTGHQVVAPDSLGDLDPERILVVNPRYTSEIRGMLGSMGCAADVIEV